MTDASRAGASALPPPPVDSWAGAPRQKIVLRNQNLVVVLPDGRNWQVQARRGSWSGLSHPQTGSEIWVRHVPARRTVTLAECQDEARLSLAYLREPLETAHERPLQAPQDYGGTVRVMLLGDGGAQVVATGVGVSRCLSVVYRAEPRAGFAQRMQVIINETLAEMRVPHIGERGILKRF